MSNIIFFPIPKNTVSPKDPEEVHSVGEAICIQCKHEWVAVVPYEDAQFECPNCNTIHGVFKYGFAPATTWTCNCGNQLFFVTPDGSLCPKCGLYH
jgi:hypothetical protein